MSETSVTKLNNLCLEKRWTIRYPPSEGRKEGPHQYDVWTSVVEVGERSWTGVASSSKKKAKESAAAAALLSLTGGEQDDERMELLKVVKKLLD